MIRSLKIRSVQLMTNNPFKISELEKHGIHISARLPHQLPANPHNRSYLVTKTTKMGHYLDLGGDSGAKVRALGDEQGENV